MGDQHQSGVVIGGELEQQFDNGRAGIAVEIAGRLIRQQDFRPAREGAGQRHALLLAAR